MAGEVFRRWRESLARSGDLGSVMPGMSRVELRLLFGEPDDVSCQSRGRREPLIWVYDGLEFHFDHAGDDKLVLIFQDGPGGVITCIQVG